MKRKSCALFAALFVTGATSTVARADDLNTAQCADAYVHGQHLQKMHKLVEARDEYRVCSQTSCKDFIVKDCSAWLDMVQASLPAVVPIVTDEAGNAIPQAKVLMDGAVLVARIDGRSVEVDPGPHTFTFEAPDGRKADKLVLVPEGDKGVRVVVVLPRPPVEGAPRAQPPAPQARAAPREPSSFRSTPWKSIGLAIASVGLVGVGAGAYFGLDAMSKRDDARCGTSCPNAGALVEFKASQRSGDLSSGFFATGGGLVLSGALLWAIAPSRSFVTAADIGPQRASFLVGSAW